MNGSERHQRAVEQSLSWAQSAADAGDLCDALGWLDTVLSVDGVLPGPWRERHGQWQQALADAVDRPPTGGTGGASSDGVAPDRRTHPGTGQAARD